MKYDRPAVAILLCALLAGAWLVAGAATAQAADAPAFEVGVAVRDVTPEVAVPMWGYAERRDRLSEGVADRLLAKAIVIRVGDDKLALVGWDIGRGPTAAMMQRIRSQVAAQAGIEHVMITGSHSHHGPVIELVDREGFGRGRFDAAVAYAQQLPELLISAIVEAEASAQPARLGVAKRDLDYNRNRHTKRTPKTTDPMLAVLRFDDLEGRPLAVLVNFAAHPVMTETMDLRFSADYPGFMQAKVEQVLGGRCVFMQGAAGDLSPNPSEERRGPQGFGEALADRVIELAQNCSTEVPAAASIQGKVDHFAFGSRLDFRNPLIGMAFSRAFFPELVANFVEEARDGIRPELNTVVLNREIALVSGSGEFFSNHSNRLKERSYLEHTLFFGYTNGHNMYFPTIEAASEGGYGADPTVSPVELGAGEQMMNRALINIYGMLRKFDPEPVVRPQ